MIRLSLVGVGLVPLFVRCFGFDVAITVRVSRELLWWRVFVSRKIDFVIDCIDSIKSKQDLAMACIQRDIPFLSSMGTARRLDPSKLEIMELEKTSYDPIAKRMRNWKRKNKIRNKIWVVCSTEPPRPVEAGKPLPSMIFVPASAGLLLASECVKKLINK